MDINSLTLGATSPSQTPASNTMASKSVRTAVSQLKESEAKILEKTQQTVEDKDESSQSALSVEDAIKRLSDFVSPSQSSLSFSVDDVSGRQVVTMVDNQSNEVIRQFPSKEAIAIARALDKLQGLLIRDKA